VLDTPMPSARKRAASQEVVRVMVKRVPALKKSAEPETPQPPKRARSRVGRSEKELVPVPMNTSRGASRSRPPREASETPVLMDAVRTAAKELGADIDVIPVPKPEKKKGPVKKDNKIIKVSKPEKKLPGKKDKIAKIDKEALRLQIRRVRIESNPEVAKRGRGRPPGSLNKKTLAARAQVAA
jgi:hypothetical protein